jgi:hypothetical protein
MEAHTFVHRKGGHCGSSALRDLLEHHGLRYGPEPLSEGMVFGLSGALAFAFAENVAAFDNPDISLPLYLNGRSEDLEECLCRHLGIGVDLRRTDDPEEAWEWLRERLDDGEPTMVWANMKDLDYQRVRLDNTRHDIVVTRYDLDEGIALVADHDFDDLQRCSLDSLARARGAQKFPGPQRHATWITSFPDLLPDLREAVAAGLGRAVATMRCEDTIAWRIWDGSGGYATVPYRQGLNGLGGLIESCESWPERFGEDGLRPVLKLLHVLLERAGTGGGFYRAFQATFLSEAAELLGDEPLRDLARAYAELAREWRDLAWAVRKGEPRTAHAEGLRRLRRARGLEERGTELMESWLARPARRVAA